MFIKPILGHQDIFCIICSGNHSAISGKMIIIKAMHYFLRCKSLFYKIFNYKLKYIEKP